MNNKAGQWNNNVEENSFFGNDENVCINQIDWSLECRKNQIFPQVIGLENLEEKNGDVPFCKWNNLAIIFRIFLQENEDEMCTAVVTNKLLNAWNINVQELYRTALQNAVQDMPIRIRDLRELVAEYIAENIGCELDEDVSINKWGFRAYVANCGRAAFGATCVIYPDFAGTAMEQVGASFYILPSSIHEVILVPEDAGILGENLRAMVRKINAENLFPEERLSEEIYYCDIKTGSICVYNG